MYLYLFGPLSWYLFFLPSQNLPKKHTCRMKTLFSKKAVSDLVGANVQVAFGSGNTANGISTAYVVYNSGAVTATLPFRIKSLVTEPPGSNGTESGAYNYVIVGFNNVSNKQLTSVG